MKRNVVVVFWVCRSQCPESGSSGLGVATSMPRPPEGAGHIQRPGSQGRIITPARRSSNRPAAVCFSGKRWILSVPGCWVKPAGQDCCFRKDASQLRLSIFDASNCTVVVEERADHRRTGTNSGAYSTPREICQ